MEPPVPPTAHRINVQAVALTLAVLATLPYLTLKLLWLGGSTVGVTDSAGLEEMHSARFVAGNTITLLLMVLAAGFVVALTRPWADRVPAAVVFVLGAGATGLLAPILLGMPLGIALQAVLDGEVKPDTDTGLAPWVFAIVYSGFGLLGVAMAVLVVAHVLRRWGALIARPPVRPTRLVLVAGAVGLLPFAVAMAYWGIRGPGQSGPQGMDLPAQRTVLVVTGLLAAAAYAAPLVAAFTSRWPRMSWLVVWTGCCVTALQGLALLLLAQNGELQPAVAAIAALSTPGACAYGLSIFRRALSPAGTSSPVLIAAR
jgi:hypothetical protein